MNTSEPSSLLAQETGVLPTGMVLETEKSALWMTLTVPSNWLAAYTLPEFVGAAIQTGRLPTGMFVVITFCETFSTETLAEPESATKTFKPWSARYTGREPGGKLMMVDSEPGVLTL